MANQVLLKRSSTTGSIPTTGDVSAGELAVNTADGYLFLGTGSAVVKVNPIHVIRETPSGTIDGSNTTFVLANVPITDTEQVFYNGQLLEPGSGNDYTISGDTITTLFTPTAGSRLKVSYLR